MKKFLLTVLSLGALSPLASAQEEAPRYLRFIPIGDLPTWSETLKDKRRQGDDFPPGSVPPDPACLVSGGEVVPLKLNLKIFTPLVTLAAATKGLTLKNGKAPESPNWFQKSKPTAPLSLGVLLPDPKNQSWDKPRVLILDDDANSFPTGTMRFVNASNKVVIIRLGGERGLRFGIAPGKTSIKPIKVGANLVKFGYRAADGSEPSILTSQIAVRAQQRVQCFFYNSNAGEGKPSVKYHYLPENLPLLPKAPK